MKPYSKIVLFIILATIFYFGIGVWNMKPPPSNKYKAYSTGHLPDSLTFKSNWK